MTTASAGWRYGLMGMPLAFMALPLYVLLPNFYAREFGVSLTVLGAVLLGARLLDALVDPWIGSAIDRMFRRSTHLVLRCAAMAAVTMAIGFSLLFAPPFKQGAALLVVLCLALLVTYFSYSLISVAHQAWGAMLGGTEAQQSRVVAWREGMGLAGVLAASVLPSVAGPAVTAVVLALLLAAAWWSWTRASTPVVQGAGSPLAHWRTPLLDGKFCRLLAVFALNGIASAIPATLLLFFVQDRLQAPVTLQPVFLGSYFLCAALSIPLWLKLVARIGLARTWLAGMALAIASFVWAAGLGAGDHAAFIVVCAMSGVALGSDLSIPAALLARLIGKAGQQGRSEGLYFGWWNFTAKLNLALAAGLALPLLALAGYSPGVRDGSALFALTLAYCILPCALKTAAAVLLHVSFIRPKVAP